MRGFVLFGCVAITLVLQVSCTLKKGQGNSQTGENDAQDNPDFKQHCAEYKSKGLCEKYDCVREVMCKITCSGKGKKPGKSQRKKKKYNPTKEDKEEEPQGTFVNPSENEGNKGTPDTETPAEEKEPSQKRPKEENVDEKKQSEKPPEEGLAEENRPEPETGDSEKQLPEKNLSEGKEDEPQPTQPTIPTFPTEPASSEKTPGENPEGNIEKEKEPSPGEKENETKTTESPETEEKPKDNGSPTPATGPYTEPTVSQLSEKQDEKIPEKEPQEPDNILGTPKPPNEEVSTTPTPEGSATEQPTTGKPVETGATKPESESPQVVNTSKAEDTKPEVASTPTPSGETNKIGPPTGGDKKKQPGPFTDVPKNRDKNPFGPTKSPSEKKPVTGSPLGQQPIPPLEEKPKQENQKEKETPVTNENPQETEKDGENRKEATTPTTPLVTPTTNPPTIGKEKTTSQKYPENDNLGKNGNPVKDKGKEKLPKNPEKSQETTPSPTTDAKFPFQERATEKPVAGEPPTKPSEETKEGVEKEPTTGPTKPPAAEDEKPSAEADKEPTVAPTTSPTAEDEKPSAEAGPTPLPASEDEKPSVEAGPTPLPASENEKPSIEAGPTPLPASENEKPGVEGVDKEKPTMAPTTLPASEDEKPKEEAVEKEPKEAPTPSPAAEDEKPSVDAVDKKPTTGPTKPPAVEDEKPSAEAGPTPLPASEDEKPSMEAVDKKPTIAPTTPPSAEDEKPSAEAELPNEQRKPKETDQLQPPSGKPKSTPSTVDEKLAGAQFPTNAPILHTTMSVGGKNLESYETHHPSTPKKRIGPPAPTPRPNGSPAQNGEGKSNLIVNENVDNCEDSTPPEIENPTVGSVHGCGEACQMECVKAFNVYRKNHRARPLHWDKHLAERAQRHADESAVKETTDHSSWVLKGGENIGYGKHKRSFTVAVKDWHDQGRNYDYNTGKSRGKVAVDNFKRIVWKKSTRIGCGKSMVKGVPFYVVHTDRAAIWPKNAVYSEFIDHPEKCDYHWFDKEKNAKSGEIGTKKIRIPTYHKRSKKSHKNKEPALHKKKMITRKEKKRGEKRKNIAKKHSRHN